MKRKTSFLVVLIIVTLAAAAMWMFSPRDAAPVQAGGGQANMNWMFDQLLSRNDFAVTLRLAAPVGGETEIVVTGNGDGGTYSYQRNGADHLCVKSPAADALTDCIPFANIASFSYEGTLQ